MPIGTRHTIDERLLLWAHLHDALQVCDTHRISGLSPLKLARCNIPVSVDGLYWRSSSSLRVFANFLVRFTNNTCHPLSNILPYAHTTLTQDSHLERNTFHTLLNMIPYEKQVGLDR